MITTLIINNNNNNYNNNNDNDNDNNNYNNDNSNDNNNRNNKNYTCNIGLIKITIRNINNSNNDSSHFLHITPTLISLHRFPVFFYTVRSAPTYLSFRKSLKTYFFNQAFPT